MQLSGSVIVSMMAIFIMLSTACVWTGQPGLVATEAPTEVETRAAEPLDITPVVGKTTLNPVDGAMLVSVPEGEFLMGSDEGDFGEDEMPENPVYVDYFEDEMPAHPVYLDAFWIYQTEVTNEQFAKFITSTEYETTAEREGGSVVIDADSGGWKEGAYWKAPEGPGSNLSGRQDHPVVHVSWYDAVAYCEWSGGVLPTEAEWEKAARGTDGRKYPWGDQSPSDQLANYNNRQGGAAPVGSYPIGASPYGALDMAGNVLEWVADLYDEAYYSVSPYENPTGIGIDEIDSFRGEVYVNRGGSWDMLGFHLSVTVRGWREPFWPSIDLGFRCVHRAAP